MNAYCIADPGTFKKVYAETPGDAVAQFLEAYNTGDMEVGETLDIDVYPWNNTRNMIALAVVEADGLGGIASWDIKAV